MEDLICQELPSHLMWYFIVVGPQLIISFTFCAKLKSSIMFHFSLLTCFLRWLICTAAQMWKITSFHFYLFAFTSASNKSQGLDKSDIWRTTNWHKMINLNSGHLIPKHSPVTSGWNPLSAPVTKFDKGAELDIWRHLRDMWGHLRASEGQVTVSQTSIQPPPSRPSPPSVKSSGGLAAPVEGDFHF